MTDQEIVAELLQVCETNDPAVALVRVHYDRLAVKDSESVYNVYVQVNSDNYITAIDSDAFIDDLTWWVKIDQGTGELYKYAKNLYLKQGVATSDGSLNYKLVRGRPVYYPQTPVSPSPTIEERLNDLETAVCELMDALAED